MKIYNVEIHAEFKFWFTPYNSRIKLWKWKTCISVRKLLACLHSCLSLAHQYFIVLFCTLSLLIYLNCSQTCKKYQDFDIGFKYWIQKVKEVLKLDSKYKGYCFVIDTWLRVQATVNKKILIIIMKKICIYHNYWCSLIIRFNVIGPYTVVVSMFWNAYKCSWI